MYHDIKVFNFSLTEEIFVEFSRSKKYLCTHEDYIYKIFLNMKVKLINIKMCFSVRLLIFLNVVIIIKNK